MSLLSDTRYTLELPRLEVSDLSRPGEVVELDCFLGFSSRLIIFAEAADEYVTVTSIFLSEVSGKTLERRVDIVNLEHQTMPGGASHRSYFVCPPCAKRCMTVFIDTGLDEPLRCRACARVAYVSQRKTPLERKSDQIQKLRRKLGSDGAFGRTPPRPSGMHRTTYARIATELESLQSELVGYIEAMQHGKVRSTRRRFFNVTQKPWFDGRDLMDELRAVFAEDSTKAETLLLRTPTARRRADRPSTQPQPSERRR